jgi:hypothetical protein
MKRLLAVALPAAALALAGCGGDTCSSAAAPLQDLVGGKTCNVTPGQVATFTIQLCGKCTDSAAACQAEFVNGQIEIAPVVQQCQAQKGCSITPECAVQPPTATCSLTIPSSVTAGTTISVQASDQNGTTVVVPDVVATNGGSGCTL